MQYVYRLLLLPLFVAVFLTPFLGVVPFVEASALEPANIIEATNDERDERDIAPLVHNEKLEAVARHKLIDMLVRGYFAHTSPTGEDIDDIADDAGYSFFLLGENLAAGTFTNAESVVKSWMASTMGHREAILNEDYRDIGVAAVRAHFNAPPFHGRKVWVVVQEFGTSSKVCTLDKSERRAVLALSDTVSELKDDLDKQKEALAQTTGSFRPSAVADYNDAADYYNAQLALLRSKVLAYNRKVKQYNSCIGKLR